MSNIFCRVYRFANLLLFESQSMTSIIPLKSEQRVRRNEFLILANFHQLYTLLCIWCWINEIPQGKGGVFHWLNTLSWIIEFNGWTIGYTSSNNNYHQLSSIQWNTPPEGYFIDPLLSKNIQECSREGRKEPYTCMRMGCQRLLVCCESVRVIPNNDVASHLSVKFLPLLLPGTKYWRTKPFYKTLSQRMGFWVVSPLSPSLTVCY